MERIKCITFDKAAQDALPQHIKDKMKADRAKARKEMDSKGLNIPCVKYCALKTLNIGDKVQIKHAHKYENGYWQCWGKVDYKYLGFKGGEYHFQNLKHEHEHFRMKNEYEDMHVFVGKHCT